MSRLRTEGQSGSLYAFIIMMINYIRSVQAIPQLAVYRDEQQLLLISFEHYNADPNSGCSLINFYFMRTQAVGATLMNQARPL